MAAKVRLPRGRPARERTGRVSALPAPDDTHIELAVGQTLFVRHGVRLPAPCRMVRTMKHVVDELLAREVAAATFTDVRTVRRVMRGEPVRGLAGARIRAELARRAATNASL